jgi:hypothetical protein
MEDHRHQGIPQQHDDAAKDEYPDDGQDHEADYFANPKPNPARINCLFIFYSFLMFYNFMIKGQQSFPKIEDGVSFPRDQRIDLSRRSSRPFP